MESQFREEKIIFGEIKIVKENGLNIQYFGENPEKIRESVTFVEIIDKKIYLRNVSKSLANVVPGFNGLTEGELYIRSIFYLFDYVIIIPKFPGGFTATHYFRGYIYSVDFNHLISELISKFQKVDQRSVIDNQLREEKNILCRTNRTFRHACFGNTTMKIFIGIDLTKS